jgi:hypothetical protein
MVSMKLKQSQSLIVSRLSTTEDFNSIKNMSTVTPTATSNAADIDPFISYLVLGQVFQDMLKKPMTDDDPDAAPSSGVASQVNKPIATAMAQAITGFGL